MLRDQPEIQRIVAIASPSSSLAAEKTRIAGVDHRYSRPFGLAPLSSTTVRTSGWRRASCTDWLTPAAQRRLRAIRRLVDTSLRRQPRESGIDVNRPLGIDDRLLFLEALESVAAALAETAEVEREDVITAQAACVASVFQLERSRLQAWKSRMPGPGWDAA